MVSPLLAPVLLDVELAVSVILIPLAGSGSVSSVTRGADTSTPEIGARAGRFPTAYPGVCVSPMGPRYSAKRLSLVQQPNRRAPSASGRFLPRNRRRTRSLGRRWQSAGRPPRRGVRSGARIARPTSWAAISGLPASRSWSSTSWPRRARSSSPTGPAVARLAYAGDGLLAVERLGRTRALEHRQLHQLDGREALLAGLADPAAPDRAAVVGDPGVEDLGVDVLAVRAVHRVVPLPEMSAVGMTK